MVTISRKESFWAFVFFLFFIIYAFLHVDFRKEIDLKAWWFFKKKLDSLYHNIQQGIDLDLWVALYLKNLFIVQKVDLDVLELFLYLNPISIYAHSSVHWGGLDNCKYKTQNTEVNTKCRTTQTKSII